MTRRWPALAPLLLFAVTACGGPSQVHVYLVSGRGTYTNLSEVQVTVRLPTNKISDPVKLDTIKLPTDFVLRFDPSVSGAITIDVTGAPNARASGATVLTPGQVPSLTLDFDGAAPDAGVPLDAGGTFDARTEAAFPPELNCLDGIDNNGDGLTDCQDPTCAPVVMCTPEVPLPDELGELDPAAGWCDGFITGQFYRQIVSVPDTCNCPCTASFTCNATLSYHTDDQCQSAATTAASLVVNTFPNGSSNRCFAVTAPMSLKSMSIGPSTPSGAITTNASPAVPTTVNALRRNFCVSLTSKTCPKTTDVCVHRPAGTDNVCTRIPQPNATCPAGYTRDLGTHYDKLVESRVCGGCSAPSVVGPVDCTGTFGTLYFSALPCMPSITDLSLDDLFVGAVAPVCGAGLNGGPVTWSRQNQSVYANNLGQANTVCTSTASVTSGTVTGQTGSTFCCTK